MEDDLLYQIKTLEKYIARLFVFDLDKKILDGCFVLTQTQMQILEYILKHKNESVYQKDLEDILQLRRATVSGVLQTMEKNHLIERVVDNEDSRIKKIILDSSAIEMYQKHLKKVKEIGKILIQDISLEEQQMFLEILIKMQDNLKIVVDKERKKEC